MSTEDRELLEMAAKAAGLELVTPTMLEHDKWNPLADDGDALRLAAALQISITYRFGATVTANAAHWCWNPTVQSGAGAESTRRAIVREAAEIGRRMA